MNAEQSSMYVLDTNVFTQASRAHYAFDVCPGFWDCLNHYQGQRMVSIDRVLSEIRKGNDWLQEWAKSLKRRLMFCNSKDQKVIESYGKIINWVRKQPRFDEAANNEFLKGADGWLIAYAMANDCTVVTYEVSAPQAKRVKIPDGCVEFGIKCCNPYEMLRKLEIKFHWKLDSNTYPPAPLNEKKTP